MKPDHLDAWRPLKPSRDSALVGLDGGKYVHADGTVDITDDRWEQKHGTHRRDGGTCGAEGAAALWWLLASSSSSLGRLSARRIPGLRSQHMHNPPVAEILQPFSPKEVG